MIYYLTLTRNGILEQEYRVSNSQGSSVECSASVTLPLSGTVYIVHVCDNYNVGYTVHDDHDEGYT